MKIKLETNNDLLNGESSQRTNVQSTKSARPNSKTE
jgi:hypothetical protein